MESFRLEEVYAKCLVHFFNKAKRQNCINGKLYKWKSIPGDLDVPPRSVIMGVG